MITENILFISVTAAVLFSILIAGFIFLPEERFQFLAAIPYKKKNNGKFKSRNLTWYGFITGFSVAVSIILFSILSVSCGFSLIACLCFISIILLISFPAAKIIAFIVERRKGTITVGGAAFTGIIISPAAAYAVIRYFHNGDFSGILPLAAALGISYLAGEGIGRLSCLSFGCCYGKPMNRFGRILRMLFSRFSVSFKGSLKKASYESGFENKKLFPIQNITALIYITACIFSIYLYIVGSYKVSFVFSITAAFTWRIISEFFRADFRGTSKISAYQIMSAIGIIICFIMAYYLPQPPSEIINTVKGLSVFSSVPFVVTVEAVWILVFLYTGISTVTDSVISFKKKK